MIEVTSGLAAGTVVPAPEPFPVTADGLERFARATFGESGGPTYAWVPVLRLLEQTLRVAGLPMRGVVHRDQTFAFERVPQPGDILDGTATVGRLRPVPGALLVSVEVQLHDQQARPVCTASSSVVVPQPAVEHRDAR